MPTSPSPSLLGAVSGSDNIQHYQTSSSSFSGSSPATINSSKHPTTRAEAEAAEAVASMNSSSGIMSLSNPKMFASTKDMPLRRPSFANLLKASGISDTVDTSAGPSSSSLSSGQSLQNASSSNLARDGSPALDLQISHQSEPFAAASSSSSNDLAFSGSTPATNSVFDGATNSSKNDPNVSKDQNPSSDSSQNLYRNFYDYYGGTSAAHSSGAASSINATAGTAASSSSRSNVSSDIYSNTYGSTAGKEPSSASSSSARGTDYSTQQQQSYNNYYSQQQQQNSNYLYNQYSSNNSIQNAAAANRKGKNGYGNNFYGISESDRNESNVRGEPPQKSTSASNRTSMMRGANSGASNSTNVTANTSNNSSSSNAGNNNSNHMLMNVNLNGLESGSILGASVLDVSDSISSNVSSSMPENPRGQNTSPIVSSTNSMGVASAGMSSAGSNPMMTTSNIRSSNDDDDDDDDDEDDSESALDYNLGKRFNQHRRPWNDSPRPFACTYPGCQWAFARVSDQRRHLRSHQRPTFHCPFWQIDPTCHRNGGSFNRLDVLKRHLKLVHFVQFKQSDSGWCRTCEKMFNSPKHFVEHCEKCAESARPADWTPATTEPSPEGRESVSTQRQRERDQARVAANLEVQKNKNSRNPKSIRQFPAVLDTAPPMKPEITRIRVKRQPDAKTAEQEAMASAMAVASAGVKGTTSTLSAYTMKETMKSVSARSLSNKTSGKTGKNSSNPNGSGLMDDLVDSSHSNENAFEIEQSLVDNPNGNEHAALGYNMENYLQFDNIGGDARRARKGDVSADPHTNHVDESFEGHGDQESGGLIPASAGRGRRGTKRGADGRTKNKRGSVSAVASAAAFAGIVHPTSSSAALEQQLLLEHMQNEVDMDDVNVVTTGMDSITRPLFGAVDDEQENTHDGSEENDGTNKSSINSRHKRRKSSRANEVSESIQGDDGLAIFSNNADLNSGDANVIEEEPVGFRARGRTRSTNSEPVRLGLNTFDHQQTFDATSALAEADEFVGSNNEVQQQQPVVARRESRAGNDLLSNLGKTNKSAFAPTATQRTRRGPSNRNTMSGMTQAGHHVSRNNK